MSIKQQFIKWGCNLQVTFKNKQNNYGEELLS